MLNALQAQVGGDQQEINDRIRDNKEGLQTNLQTRTPDGAEVRVCDGTPIGDGKSPGENTSAVGGSSPQEWSTDGQQNRKLGINARKKARQRDAEGKKTYNNVPKLQSSVFSKRECPLCDGELMHFPLNKIPSTVLDCFAGAGTTLWVAKKLNRQAIGFDISEEYCQLALERNRQQVLI